VIVLRGETIKPKPQSFLIKAQMFQVKGSAIALRGQTIKPKPQSFLIKAQMLQV
jgi:hypothetical protein